MKPERWLILLFCSAFTVGVCASAAHASAPPANGTIRGVVIDSASTTPLAGANIRLVGHKGSAVTDSGGRFLLKDLPAGPHTLRISFVGYETLDLRGVVVDADTVADLRAEMRVALLPGQNVIVESDHRTLPLLPAIGAVRLSQEELRHTAGFSEDVIRSVSSMPGVARISDVLNTMVVRGGSPCENGFYIDGIPVPDINHLPMHGSSGGPVSLINNELVQDIRLQLGGFDAAYGGRLSSIMELDFREGDRSRFHGLLDASIAGLGVLVEGPLTRRGSFVIAARRGFLDQLLKRTEKRLAPRCDDYQGKLTFDVTPSHRLSAIAVAGVDRFKASSEEAWQEWMNFFGEWRAIPFTFGGTWNARWTTGLQSQTSLSQHVTNYQYITHRWNVGTSYQNRSRDRAYSLRHVTRWQIDRANELRLGFEVEHQINDEDFEIPSHWDPFGQYIMFLRRKLRVRSTALGFYAVHSRRFSERFTTTLGCRADYYSLTNHISLSPRMSATLRLGRNTSVDLATGLYRQTLPLTILSQNDRHKELRDPVSYHLILQLRKPLADGADLALAVYSKWYKHLPIDMAEPELLVLDEVLYPQVLWFQQHEKLADSGIGVSQGLELLFRQRLARGLYGLVGGSLSSARYRDGNRAWHDRIMDNRYSVIAEGGWKVTPSWRVSFRWVFAGGMPYTPFDTALTWRYEIGIFDTTHINGLRMPPCQVLNLRIDKRFSLGGTTLSAYMVVWNVLDRENMNSYFWHEASARIIRSSWLGRLVIFGLEYRI
jgi:hypothetical protein